MDSDGQEMDKNFLLKSAYLLGCGRVYRKIQYILHMREKLVHLFTIW